MFFFHSGGGALIARCILMLYDPVYRPHNLFWAQGRKRLSNQPSSSADMEEKI